MIRDLALDIEIRVCPTVRDEDGLALSSRNAYLSPEEREAALALPKALHANDPRLLDGLQVDYFELAEFEPPVLAAAVRIGGTRLIDNVIPEGETDEHATEGQDASPPARRDEAPRRADRDGHRLRRTRRPLRRGRRNRGHSRRRHRGHGRARPRGHDGPRDDGRDGLPDADGGPRGQPPDRDRRHAVRLVPGLRRGRRPQRDPLRQGGRRRRGQARGRRTFALARARDRCRRNPGDGPRRPDAAVGDDARRVQDPGQDGRGGATARRRRAGARGGRLRSRSCSRPSRRRSRRRSPAG